MKKLRVLYSVLFTVWLGAAVIGCTNAGGGLPQIDPEDQKSESDPGSGGNGSGSSGTNIKLTAEQVEAFQKKLSDAAEGAVIKLTEGKVPAGSTITINKALTVDGSGVEGLTVKIASEILKDINIKNFKKVKIELTKKAGGRETLVTDNQTENGSFKKYGDDALPLKLEGCTVEDLKVAGDVALYLGTGKDKTTIENINLAEGVEDFTFVENDKDDDGNNIADGEKSSVGKLYVENGVREINLIGGSFGDVNFADNFASKVDVNYDTETEQFKNKAFLDGKTVEKKDISIVESEDTSSKSVYKFEMSKADFEYFNKYMSVIFLTDDQVKALQSGTEVESAWWQSVDFDTPVYDMSVMGTFAADGIEGNGLYPVYGTAEMYLDWSYALLTNTKLVKEIYLEKYKNYNKDSLIVKVDGDKVTVYVDTAAIKKTDLFMCACPGYDPTLEYQEAIYECGSKLSKITVESYKPYFVFHKNIYYDLNAFVNFEYHNDMDGFTGFIKNKFSVKPVCEDFFQIPCTNNQKFARDYIAFPMEAASSYPDVSSVKYSDITITANGESVEVYYYDSNLNLVKKADVLIVNVNEDEDYEYYMDEEFTETNSDYILNGHDEQSIKTLYARPRRKVRICQQADLASPGESGFEYPEIDHPYFNIKSLSGDCSDYLGHRVIVYKDYDEATGEFSNKISSIKDMKDGDTIYIIADYVTLYIFDPDSPDTTPILIGKKNTRDLVNNSWNVAAYQVTYYTAPNKQNTISVDELQGSQQCGAPVYYNQEMVVKQLDPDYPELEMYCDSEKVSYFTFKKRVSAGEKYYFSSDSDTPITVADLEKLLTDKAFDCVPYPVYKKGIVVTEIKSADDLSSKNVAVAAILNIFDEGFYHFYSDLEMTKELSREDVAKLGAGDNVYIHSNVLQVKCMSLYHTSCKNVDIYGSELYGYFDVYEDTVGNIISRNKMHPLEFYKEESLTNKYTEEDLKKLPEGTLIYTKEDCVQPYVIYYNDITEFVFVSGIPEYDFYSIDRLIEMRILPNDGRYYTDKEKKNEISKDEIGTLPECSPVYVYVEDVVVVIEGPKPYLIYYNDAEEPISVYATEDMRFNTNYIDNLIGSVIAEDARYYTDKEKTNEISKDDIGKLPVGSSVYVYYVENKVNIHFFEGIIGDYFREDIIRFSSDTSFYKDLSLTELLTAEEIEKLEPGTTIYQEPASFSNGEGWLVNYEGVEKPEYLNFDSREKLLELFDGEKYVVYSDSEMKTPYEFELEYDTYADGSQVINTLHVPPSGMRFFVKEK